MTHQANSDVRPPGAPERTIVLRDGSNLDLFTLTSAIPEKQRRALLEMLNTEWKDGDVRWSESMTGHYADSLTIVTAIGLRDDQCVGAASIAYAAREAEVGAVCDVFTHYDARQLGIARATTETVCNHFLQGGGRVVYLGTERDGVAWRVYQRIGFQWFHGAVMRYVPDGSESFDEDYFASEQETFVRPAEWGDLAGVSALFGVPYRALAGDYTRGIFSPAYTFHPRCVSVFPTIYYDTIEKGGRCTSLIGDTAHRVVGLASITPIDTKYRQHVGVLEVMTHDNHVQDGPRLVRATLAAGRDAGISRAVAYVPVVDEAKGQWLHSLGGSCVGRLHALVQLDDRAVDVEIMELSLESLTT